MFKNAVSLEEAGKTQIVVLDKTGTITSGEPKLTDILPEDGISEETLLELAYALESKSEHPLAKAIMEAGKERDVNLREVSGFKALPGNGLEALIDGKPLTGGRCV